MASYQDVLGAKLNRKRQAMLRLALSTFTWPTRPVSDAGGYNLRRAIEIRSGSHAFEAKVFNVVAAGCIDVSMRDALARLPPTALETFNATPRGVSMVLDPTGEVISDLLSDTEGIVYAEIDVARCVEPKQFHDVVGYYNRFDVFHLTVDRSPRNPAAFVGDEASVVDRSEEPPSALPARAEEPDSDVIPVRRRPTRHTTR
jgi:aliphatic nitrilase